jgi:hypothetical protein
LPSRDTTEFLGFELRQQGDQVGAGECPLKRLRRLFLARLEREESIFEFLQRREVRRDNLALDDRKVDFNLVEPTRVIGSMDESHGGPSRTKARGGFLSPRCEKQLSVIQNTRRAERYGSTVITWSTSRSTTPIVVLIR